ncbi:MAG: hypothetical protein ACJ8CR_38700 [Roseiflexaceae bacterium]
MALKIVVGIAAALIVWLGFVGLRRDLRRGVVALAGTLLGAIMAGFWGDRWGQSLAERFVGGDTQRLTFVVSSLVFLFCALVVGYGGGLLLGPKERAPFQRRLVGGLLGILNGALIAAYLLRFGAENDAAAREIVQEWLPSRMLLDGLPLLFLIVTGGLAVLVLVRVLLSFGGYEPVAPAKKPIATSQKPAATAPAAAASTAAAPSNHIDEHDILGKVNDALRR